MHRVYYGTQLDLIVRATVPIETLGRPGFGRFVQQPQSCRQGLAESTSFVGLVELDDGTDLFDPVAAGVVRGQPGQQTRGT